MKKLLLILPMLIILASFVYADLNENLVGYYGINMGAGITLINDVGTNATMNDETNFIWHNESWKGGEANNSNIECDSGAEVNKFIDTSLTTCSGDNSNCSISFWLNVSDFSASNAIIGNGISNTEFDFLMNSQINNSLSIAHFDGSVKSFFPIKLVLDKSFHIVIVKNQTNWQIYIDGTIESDYIQDSTNGGDLLLFQTSTLDSWGRCNNLKIDEIGIWNFSITQNDVDTLWNNSDGNFYPFSEIDAIPPNLSNAICTSCASGTNGTVDSTPTINVTCIDDLSDCTMVRIANDSTLTFDTAGETRNCTQGIGNTWFCTLASSDELTDLDVAQPIYFWALDDFGNNHSNFNLTIDVTLITAFLKLDGLEENRTYEYETTVNITSSFPFIDILDNTFRFRNQISNFLYLINLLRENKFTDGTIEKNVTSGSSASVLIDNRTDLYNASVNITGFSNPRNVTINSSGQIINFPGTLIGNNLYQNLFIFSGVLTNEVILVYTSAGSKTILFNYSSTGNPLNRNGTFNLTITALDLDKGNDLDFNETFLDDIDINLTSLKNTSAPMSIFDDFESVTPDRWDCINGTNTGVSGFNCSISEGNIDDYFDLFIGVNWGPGETLGASVNLDYDAPEITLENISRFNISLTWINSYDINLNSDGFVGYGLDATDGTNTVSLISVNDHHGWFAEATNTLDKTFHGFKNPDGTWDIYENNTLKKDDISLSSLNSPISLRFRVSASGIAISGGQAGFSSSRLRIKNYNTSGIRLKRNDGVYEINVSNGTFESNTLKNTENNIVRAFLTVINSVPEFTTIDYFLSNNNGSDYESVIPDTFHTFVTTGKALKVKFVLNSTNNLTSPYISEYRVQIIPASPSGLTIDVGDDGIIDMRIEGELNSSNTPIRYNGTDEGFNKYINASCQGLPSCAVPVKFTIGSGGNINISDANATQNINPVRFNITPIQSLSSIPFKLTYTDGIAQLSDIRFDFRGSKNITVVAHTGDYSTSLNRTISVLYSIFNVTILPQSIDWWDIGPNIYTWNQSNIVPFGNANGDGNPFWNISSTIWGHNMDIYVRYNESINTCVTKQEFRGQNMSFRANNTLSSLNITNLTTTSQIIISDLNKNMSTIIINVVSAEDFENNDLGTWTSVGDVPCAWTPDKLGTPSGGTGPCVGITSCGFPAGADGTDFYAFVETSGGSCSSGTANVNLTSENIDFTIVTNLAFAYNMYGGDIGKLTVLINTAGTWTQLWSRTGAQGSPWRKANLDLSSYSGDGVIRFNYDRNGDSGFLADVAIDQISITSPPIIDTASFANIQSYTMINCSENKGELFFPYFCFNSICSDCVKTSNFDTNCDFIE